MLLSSWKQAYHSDFACPTPASQLSNWWRKERAFSLSNLAEWTPTTANGESAYLDSRRAKEGRTCMQLMQQNVQKSYTTTLPLSSLKALHPGFSLCQNLKPQPEMRWEGSHLLSFRGGLLNHVSPTGNSGTASKSSLASLEAM